MTKNPRDVNEDLVRQEVEKGRMGDRKLAHKPGQAPGVKNETENRGPEWDDDQRALLDNQDPNKLKRSGQQGSE